MRMFDVIKTKRDGNELSTDQIKFFVSGYVKGKIPDYQAAALCMAIYFRGLNQREICDLTFEICNSGPKYSYDQIKGLTVDKHSTGGVGDKTSLVVAPIVASLGVKVAKSCGRGLGYTGGTADKLESITGYRIALSPKEIIHQVNKIGIAIVGNSEKLAPVDKLLYALRDVTATMDSLPLVASSIMGKKLATDDDCIVLDVTTGSGAFAKTLKDAKILAKTMVNIGKNAGKKMLALITDMDKPLGYAVGNSLEVIEAVQTLKGCGPKDLTQMCIVLASNMLFISGYGTIKQCEKAVQRSIESGIAFEKFVQLVQEQGGDVRLVQDTNLFAKTKFQKQIVCPTTGYIQAMNTENIGIASLLLGAGRNTKEEQIDHAAGILLCKKTGDFVQQGEVLATLFTNKKQSLQPAEEKMFEALSFSKTPPQATPLVLAKIK